MVDVVYHLLASMLMDTFLSSIVPILRSIDDMVDAWDNIGFKHEQEEEKNQ